MPKGIPRDQSTQRTILHRMKIARGHLDRVITMVKQGDYCIDIIHQSQAVQAALKGVDRTVLKNHLETCVADSIKKGQTKEVVAEVMKIVGKQ